MGFVNTYKLHLRNLRIHSVYRPATRGETRQLPPQNFEKHVQLLGNISWLRPRLFKALNSRNILLKY